MTNNTTNNGMFDTSTMWALDEALQAEIVDLGTPTFIPFGEEWDAGLGTLNRIPIFDKQVVKDHEPISQAFQDAIDAKILEEKINFKNLFFKALYEDSERSGLFTKQVDKSDDSLINLSQQQAETNKTQAEANLILANAQTSKDVVKDLEEESVKKDTGGRRKSVKIENLRGEKPGWGIAKDSNFWSVNEKDPYWQTKAGYKEAMDLYGTKPAWVKESSLEYNPKTGKYDPIEKEEFVEIKPKKRISL